MTDTDQPDWRERRRGQTEPGGPRQHVIVDQHGRVRDLHAVNRRLLDPSDADTLRRLLHGLRALEPDPVLVTVPELNRLAAAAEADATTSPPGVEPHPYTGDPDRYCQRPGCGKPDRNPVHATRAAHPGWIPPTNDMTHAAFNRQPDDQPKDIP